MAICTVLFEKLYTIFKIKRAQEQGITKFSFKMFKIMDLRKSSKCLKTTVELTFTNKKQTPLVLGLLVLFSTANTFFG